VKVETTDAKFFFDLEGYGKRHSQVNNGPDNFTAEADLNRFDAVVVDGLKTVPQDDPQQVNRQAWRNRDFAGENQLAFDQVFRWIEKSTTPQAIYGRMTQDSADSMKEGGGSIEGMSKARGTEEASAPAWIIDPMIDPKYSKAFHVHRIMEGAGITATGVGLMGVSVVQGLRTAGTEEVGKTTRRAAMLALGGIGGAGLLLTHSGGGKLWDAAANAWRDISKAEKMRMEYESARQRNGWGANNRDLQLLCEPGEIATEEDAASALSNVKSAEFNNVPLIGVVNTVMAAKLQALAKQVKKTKAEDGSSEKPSIYVVLSADRAKVIDMVKDPQLLSDEVKKWRGHIELITPESKTAFTQYRRSRGLWMIHTRNFETPQLALEKMPPEEVAPPEETPKQKQIDRRIFLAKALGRK